jgi:hypothetical protein
METMLTGRKVPNVSLEALQAFGQGSKARAQSFAQEANQSLAVMPTWTRNTPLPNSPALETPAWNGSPLGSSGSADGGKMSGDLKQYGFADNVPASLINTESGGNWGARNNEAGSGGNGHYGILQFGNGRLADVKNAGVIPADMTPEQFMASKPAQVAAANWHFSDIDNRIKANGFDRYIGQTIGGVVVSMDGMRAMAHLGGFGGLSKFINTGGQNNPADSFGTSLAAYGRTHQSNH